jgi:outer membrane protein TolC
MMLAVAMAVLLGAPSVTQARTYTLSELLVLAKRSSPSVAAAAGQTEGVKALLIEAQRHWMPTGEFLTMLAPAPDIRCQTDLPVPEGIDARAWRQSHCDRTNVFDASLDLRGIFARSELTIVQPLYTFGKIEAGIAAAEAGIMASRNQERGVIAELELNVKKAYFGAKLARALLGTLREGEEQLTRAQDTVEHELKTQSGNMTVTDRLRLRTMAAQLRARILDTEKLGRVAESGLRALIGPHAPKDIELDPDPMAAVSVPARDLAHYEAQAFLLRPEIRAFDFLLASKRAQADLERRKQYPDVVLLGTARAAFTSSVDNPRNAFYSDPFNTLSGGLAAALRMPLDLGVKNAQAMRAQAAEEQMQHQRREAQSGITFQIHKAYYELEEAQRRLAVMQDGEKAGQAWVGSVAQGFSAGLAEAKDFADALLTYFQFRAQTLQAIYDVNVTAAVLSRAVGQDITKT